ncbi:MAG: hypothetical protein OSJ45_10490 [Lachnospiraceae bacterium]|nr:hypothetical protein [Lachnospiraceae bacterium]
MEGNSTFNSRVKQAVHFNNETDGHMNRGLVTQTQPCSIQEQPGGNPYQNYQKKLYCQNEIELNKRAFIQKQNIYYQQVKAEVKARTDASKLLTSSEIYTDSSGRLMYVLRTPDIDDLASVELLNARGYRTCMYCSGYPYEQKVLAVSWNYGEHVVYFPYGIDASRFIRKLNSHGLRLMVSGRMQKDAGSALLSYSIENAEKIEIPFDYGWWMDMGKKWHFATRDENIITMKEIRRENEW